MKSWTFLDLTGLSVSQTIFNFKDRHPTVCGQFQVFPTIACASLLLKAEKTSSLVKKFNNISKLRSIFYYYFVIIATPYGSFKTACRLKLIRCKTKLNRDLKNKVISFYRNCYAASAGKRNAWLVINVKLIRVN